MNIKYNVKRFVFKNPLLKKLYHITIQRAKNNLWRKKLKENGWEILSRITTSLDVYNIDYFLDSGTLLGMVREGGFISHDTDMDLGVFYKNTDIERKLEEALMHAGLKRHHAFYFQDKVCVVTYTYESFSVDFFLYFETENQYLYNQYCFCRDIWKTYPNDDVYDVYQADCPITGLKKIEINNLKLSIPKNAEEYLASIYTENWRIPNTNWNYLDSPRLHFVEGEYGVRKDKVQIKDL